MSSRKDFITAVVVTSAALSVGKASADPAAPAGPETPQPSPKPVSPAARELALRFRKYDSTISDKELETIARGIDGNLDLGSQLNPRGKKLRNGDEFTPSFEVGQ